MSDKKLQIICLVKIVPDVEHFVYDYEKNILVRENTKSIINQDDACAVAAALNFKKKYGAEITVMSMGAQSAKSHLEDIIRRGADKAVLITDPLYMGSDTYVTARILARCIQRYDYDMIFCGVRSMDGDTAHIPPQIAELLDINVMSNISALYENTLSESDIQFEVKDGRRQFQFSMKYPAVFGISSESKYKLPFARYEDLKKEVAHCIEIITNKELDFLKTQVGLNGSKTKVMRTYAQKDRYKKGVVVQTDESGIEYTYKFLKENGFI